MRVGTKGPPTKVGLLLAACAVVLALRCGGESQRDPLDSGVPPGRIPDPTPTAETLELASAQCDYLERCDTDAMFFFAGESRAACEEFFACEAAYLPDDMLEDSCIESLTTRDCPELRAEGALGRFSYGTSFPWGPDCGKPTLDELLAPPPDAPGPGEPCIKSGERASCEVGSYCATDEKPFSGTVYCGTCEPDRTLGEPCESRDRCVEGASCEDGVCVARSDLGEACELDRDCRSDTCDGSTCVSRYAPAPLASTVGNPCENESDCGNLAMLWCDDGACRTLPGEGEACAHVVTFGHPDCRLGYSCVAGRCRALGCRQDVGEPCEDFCESGECIDGACVPPPETLGDACTLLCGDGLMCISGHCAKANGSLANGLPCDFSHDCESGFCERYLGDYCEEGSCSIPRCDGCGVCAEQPTVERCSAM
jgi:hypothetical protein